MPNRPINPEIITINDVEIIDALEKPIILDTVEISEASENLQKLDVLNTSQDIDELNSPQLLAPSNSLSNSKNRQLPVEINAKNNTQILKFQPHLQSFEHYIQSIQKIPLLTEQEEKDLLQSWRQHQNPQAARRLVMAHLRLVYAITRQYLGYGLPNADLMQEGSLGLMMAVKKFEPKFNARLATYATYWIKAYIHEYILQNWRLIKIASTVIQKKLFFKLRSLLPPDSNITPPDLQKIADKLGVQISDIQDMQTRLTQREQSIDEEHNGQNLQEIIADKQPEPMLLLEQHQQQKNFDQLPKLLEDLRVEKPRVFDIIQQRWVNDKKSTMKDLSKQLDISIERVNQLEKQGLQWLKQKFEQNVKI
jgi:RNA polymerase sigma-32 factor